MSQRRIGRIAGLASLTFFLGAGGFWWYLRMRDREEEAIRTRLESRGGTLTRFLNVESPLLPLRGWLGPTIADPFIGTDGFVVGIPGTTATRANLAEIQTLGSIRSVMASGNREVDDDWVVGLRDPEKMLGLYLEETTVTDRSIESIARMSNLRQLGLLATAVSDSGVDRLRSLRNLYTLSIGGSNIRAIRLVSSEIVDDSGRPATHPASPIRVRGRIAVGELQGRLGSVRVMVRSQGDPPRWVSVPYGWNAARSGTGNLSEEAPGIWSFDVPIQVVPAGESSVEVWVEVIPFVRPNLIRYRMEPFLIELAPESSPANPARDVIAEPVPAR